MIPKTKALMKILEAIRNVYKVLFKEFPTTQTIHEDTKR